MIEWRVYTGCGTLQWFAKTAQQAKQEAEECGHKVTKVEFRRELPEKEK